MMDKEKAEPSSVNISETPCVSPDAALEDSSKSGTTLLETQTRTRRLFSQTQLFAFSLVYLGTWYSSAM